MTVLTATDRSGTDHAITFRSDITVELMSVPGAASDASVIAAARISTQGADSAQFWEMDPAESTGLIKFLARNRHGTPFEHNQFIFRVSAPIFVYREWHRHRVGWCLAGDTQVWTETIAEKSGRTLRKRAISEIFDRWHNGVTDSTDRTRHLPSSRAITVRTLDEGTGQFVVSRVVDVLRNGVKPVVAMETMHGERLRCTTDHAVWTPEGWAKVGDIQPGDLVARSGKVALNPGRQIPPSLRAGIGVWTSMQRPTLLKPIDTCHLCGELFDADDLHLDHVVPVAENLKLALDVDNLKPACEPCHREKTSSEQSLAVRGQTAGVVWTAIESIVPDGEEMTYDLELEGPMRGFVADGVVVHNSYNEESGRYSVLEPAFYLPGTDRKLIEKPGSKAGNYEYVPGTTAQHDWLVQDMMEDCVNLYTRYQDRLWRGYAKEVARMTLPVNIYSSMYATCNARSLMAFLSLRTERSDAVFPSKPMREIAMASEEMERIFAETMPITWAAFEEFGRVGP